MLAVMKQRSVNWVNGLVTQIVLAECSVKVLLVLPLVVALAVSVLQGTQVISESPTDNKYSLTGILKKWQTSENY
jgi:hypothetical protein